MIFINILLLISSIHCQSEDWVETGVDGVLDYKENPILKPSDLLEWILGDPTVVLFEEEDELHMFVNEIFHGILHFKAQFSDPTHFIKQESVIPDAGSVRPYAYRVGKTVYLYYEQYHASSLFRESSILVRQATIGHDDDGSVVFNWSNSSQEILRPELEWELIGTKRVGNPFVFLDESDGLYHLMYSASSIHLPDSNIDEPLYLGRASGPSPMGPFEKLEDPIVVETGSQTVLGLGSLKLIKPISLHNGVLHALNNRVTLNAQNQTGSTIALLGSTDGGYIWYTVKEELIAPQLEDPSSWKHAYVYGYDTVKDPDNSSNALVYYNARNSWAFGIETIGVSKLVLDELYSNH